MPTDQGPADSKSDFWLELWREGRIPFHKSEVNPHLAAHWPALGVAPPARVFVPLCGKTRDIAWLRSLGHLVCGAELSPIAVAELFAEMDLTPEITPAGPLTRHAAAGIEIFLGDLFALTPGILGPVDALYDRAALIALPPELRGPYTDQLARLAPGAPQLLITFEAPGRTEGPPFSVPRDEVRRLNAARAEVTLHAVAPAPGPGSADDIWLIR